MKQLLLPMLICTSLYCCSQTVNQSLKSIGVGLTGGTYNDLMDIPYEYSLDQIGHPIDFDTLIVTAAENLNFHNQGVNQVVLDTISKSIFYADRTSGFITDYILITKRDTIHRFYQNKKIIEIVDISSGKWYSTRKYKYNSKGQLDSLIVIDNHGTIRKVNDSSHLKKYDFTKNYIITKTKSLVTKVIEKSRGKYHNLIYKNGTLYQIVGYDLKTNKKEYVSTFNNYELMVSSITDDLKTEYNYHFNKNGRWIQVEESSNSKLYSIVNRKYLK